MNMDISDIPSDQMDKLASIVTQIIGIRNMTPTSRVSSILACVQCPELWLGNMKLSEENTRALVAAMRNRVQTVGQLFVTHIKELTQYDGQGRCRELRVWCDTWTLGRLRRWAADKRWTVTQDNDVWLLMWEGIQHIILYF